jgi:flagellar protein FlgJ
MTNMMGMISKIDPTLPVASTDTGTKDAKLRQACADFESIFVNYVLRSARKALPQQGFFHHTREGKIYESMMDEQMARSVAGGRGLGLGELLYEQLEKHEKHQFTFSDSAFDPIRSL